jgi:hypothetical protein
MLYILYMPSEPESLKTTHISPMLQLVNAGSPIDLRKLRIRYWIKDELKDQGYSKSDYVYSISKSTAFEGNFVNDLTPIPTVIEDNSRLSYDISPYTNVELVNVDNAGLQDMAFDVTFDGGLSDRIALLDTAHIAKVELAWDAYIQYPKAGGYYFDQGNDWSYAPNYPDPAAVPTYVSHPLTTGLITAYYDNKIIYGQEPVQVGKYEQHINCGGYGFTSSDANKTEYVQDHVYGVGGWGVNTFRYWYNGNPNSFYYKNFYTGFYYNGWSTYSFGFNYYYSTSFAGTGADNVLYQSLARSWSIGYLYNGSGYQSYSQMPAQYVFDNLPDGEYEITFNLIAPTANSQNDSAYIAIDNYLVLSNYNTFEQSGNQTGIPQHVKVNFWSYGGRMDIKYWDTRYNIAGYSSPDGGLASIDIKLVDFRGTSRKIEPGKSMPPDDGGYYYYNYYNNNYLNLPVPTPGPAEIIPDTCNVK